MHKLYLLILLVAVGCSNVSGANPQVFPVPDKKVEVVKPVKKELVEENKEEVKELPRVIEEPKPKLKSRVSPDAIKFQDPPCPSADTVTPAPPLPPVPPAPNPNPTPPVIVLPMLALPTTVTGNVGDYIKITAVTNGSEVRWYPVTSGLAVFPGEMLKTSLSTVVHANQPGTYQLLAYTALQDIPSNPVTVMVVVNGPQPPPAPTPQPTPIPPGPTPQPTPVATPTNLWIVFIDDVTARTPATAAIATNIPYWQSLVAKGHQYAIIDKADQAAVANFMPLITKNGGIPIVIIMNAATRVVLNNNPTDLKVPATIDQFNALITKYAGK